jgi:hypothetical protein
MKKLLLLLLLMPIMAYSQTEVCVKVDSVYSTAKLRELGNRDIRFGIKQITEDMLSNKYCLSDKGEDLDVEVFYFGIPKTTIRIVGVEKTNQVTQVGVRIYYRGQKFEGYGESETEVRAVMIELVDGKVPFSKMTVSNALKKAIEECILKMP